MEYVFQENDRGVKISGELVFTDYRDFRALWGRLLNTKSGQSVTIDLSELQFIDSAGLGSSARGNLSCPQESARAGEADFRDLSF